MRRKVLRIFCTLRNALWALEDDGLLSALRVCDRTAYSLLWVHFDDIPKRERTFRYAYAAACSWAVLLGLTALCMLIPATLVAGLIHGFDVRLPVLLYSGFAAGGFVFLGLVGLIVAQGVALHLSDRRYASAVKRDL